MDNIQVRRAMTVVLLSADPQDELLLHSVRVVEKFVSEKLELYSFLSGDTVESVDYGNVPASLEEKRRAISYKAMEAVRSNPDQRPKVAPTKVKLAIELLQGGWLSHREIANRVKLKIGTVRTTLMPAVKREIPHTLKFKRQRFGAQGKFKYHLKDVRAFK